MILLRNLSIPVKMYNSISYYNIVSYRENVLFSTKIDYIYKLLFDLSIV